MLNAHTNRRPMTRLARFSSLGVLVLVAILVASLQVANAVEQPPTTEPSLPWATANLTASAAGGTVTISAESIKELVAALAILQEELQTVPNDSADRSNEPIRIGNGVRPPAKVHDVPPVYPPAARTAGIDGVVILEVTIVPTGEVGDIEVLHSVPELDEAAIAAVEQWRYEPTLVDGVPVPVLMTATINFSLQSP